MSTACGGWAAARLVGVPLGGRRIGRRTASHRLHDHPRRDALIGQHQRSMRALVEEETGGEAAGPFDVDDVGFAVRRFRFTAVGEFERHRRRRREEERDGKAGELGARRSQRLRFRRPMPAAGGGGMRTIRPGPAFSVFELRISVSPLTPLISDDGRVAHRADAVGPDHLVRQLHIDRQFAGDLAVAHLARERAGGTEPLDLRQLAARRRAPRAPARAAPRLSCRPRRPRSGCRASCREKQRTPSSAASFTSQTSMTSARI